MKAIKIDALHRLVGEVEFDGSLDTMYKLLGHGCNMITAPVIFNNRDTVYVDDEGLLRPVVCGWTLKLPNGTFYRFVGNGLILGCDSAGFSISVKGKIAEYTSMIGFMDQTEAILYQEYCGF